MQVANNLKDNQVARLWTWFKRDHRPGRKPLQMTSRQWRPGMALNRGDIWAPVALLASVSLLPACVTKPLKQSAKKREPAAQEELANETLTPKPPPAIPQMPAAKRPSAATAKSTTNSSEPAPEMRGCLTLVSRFVPPLRRLAASLPKAIFVPAKSPLEAAINGYSDACKEARTRTELVQAITETINGHSRRFGLILPLSGPNAEVARSLVHGMRAAVQEAGGSFDRQFILLDSGSGSLEQRVAELVLIHKVTALIGGFARAEAEQLTRWSNDLLLPVILLNRDERTGLPSKYAFVVYPNERRLAETLAAQALQKGLKRVAILKPQSHKSDMLSTYFTEVITAHGGVITADLTYQPNNFDSMQNVSKQLFKANPDARTDDYRQAYLRAKDEAERLGQPFDSRLVVLKPIVDMDAVLIPDDFRTVRHFAKLFRFLMVGRMTLIGNHEWRSPSLVEPFDDFLSGSFFADFIGSYAELPAAIKPPLPFSPLFAEPQDVVKTDFGLIGYRAGRVAVQALSQTPAVRRHLARNLVAMTSHEAMFFGQGPVFDQNRQSQWPTFVFTVRDRGLSLEAAPALSDERGKPVGSGH